MELAAARLGFTAQYDATFAAVSGWPAVESWFKMQPSKHAKSCKCQSSSLWCMCVCVSSCLTDALLAQGPRHCTVQHAIATACMTV